MAIRGTGRFDSDFAHLFGDTVNHDIPQRGRRVKRRLWVFLFSSNIKREGIPIVRQGGSDVLSII